jgi:hypothetical protein
MRFSRPRELRPVGRAATSSCPRTGAGIGNHAARDGHSLDRFRHDNCAGGGHHYAASRGHDDAARFGDDNCAGVSHNDPPGVSHRDPARRQRRLGEGGSRQLQGLGPASSHGCGGRTDPLRVTNVAGGHDHATRSGHYDSAT